MDFRQECLNLCILIELTRLIFEYQIISHTARREFPYAGFIFAAISMRVEMTGPFIPGVFQQFDQEEEILDRLRTEAQVLIEARTFLIVEIDMKELASFDCLSNHVIEIETGHLLMPDFRIDANHVRMIERRDKAERGARRRQINITARFIRLGF